MCIEIVGSSEIWYVWEDYQGICHKCSGDGSLATTDRAAYYPEQFPYELKKCPSCDGTKIDRNILRQTV